MGHPQAVQQVAQCAVVPDDEAVPVGPHAAALAGADHLVIENRHDFTDRPHDPAVNREITKGVVVGGGLADARDGVLVQVEGRDDVLYRLAPKKLVHEACFGRQIQVQPAVSDDQYQRFERRTAADIIHPIPIDELVAQEIVVDAGPLALSGVVALPGIVACRVAEADRR